jgi:hypothetical protein
MNNRWAALGVAGRDLVLRPSNHGQVWILSALGLAVPALVVFSVFGFLNDWARPWPELAIVWPPAGLVLNGLAGSVGLSRRGL